MKAVTRAAEEPKPVLWARWRGTLKFVKVVEPGMKRGEVLE